MPAKPKEEALKLINSRHPEYARTLEQSRWLLDTLAADAGYRDGTYGLDRYGLPRRNLVRLPQELPLRDANGVAVVSGTPRGSPFYNELNQSETQSASEEMYEVRRDRTPVPQFLPRFLENIMGKIYKRQITRSGPAEMIAWTENVDGRRTSLDEWMRDTVAPILCALGMIDVGYDHPVIDPDHPDLYGAPADPGGCVVRVILPEHMLWWIKDKTGFFYLECLVREFVYDTSSNKYVWQYRHWTSEDWVLYSSDGEVRGMGFHTYRIAPFVRLFDKKNIRYDDVGRSRFWGVADKSRAYYNEESELILNDTYNNCPLLQGPPDDDNKDDGIAIGRNLMLKMVEDRNGNLHGYEYVEMSSQTNTYMMERLNMIQSMMESEAGLTRSAGATGRKGETAGAQQSGLSKAYDQSEGADYLASISKMLATNDWAIMFFALIVLSDGGLSESDINSISAVYPTRFNLLTFDQIAVISAAIQEFKLGPVGQVPSGDKQTLMLMYKELHPDLDAKTMRAIEDEIGEYVDAKAEEWKNKPAPDLLAAPIPGANGVAVPAIQKPATVPLTLPHGVVNPIPKN